MRERRLTPQLTDRRRKRVLAVNPASDGSSRSNSKRGAALRVKRLCWAVFLLSIG